DWEAANRRLAELNAKAEDPKLWDDPSAAQSLLRERTRLDRAIEGYRRIEREVGDAVGLIELGEAEGDKAIVAEAEANLEKLRDEAKKREVESLLSGEADGNDCYLEVHAGAGGTEAQDWAEMLLRMYVRWAEAHGYKTEWLEESGGEEAGIKSATVRIAGPDAYGWLKTESGVHRLVRISPFDSNARLYDAELQRREAATDAMNATKTDIGWGHQIRSYVLQPYQMVKDLRTGVETGNTGAVLDGDLDRFLAAALASRIEGAEAIPTNA